MAKYLGVPARRGEIVKERITVAEFADGSPVSLPVLTASGAHDGPTLYIQAGIHGDELTGVEVCRQLLAGLDPSEMSGTVVSVPVANLPSYLTRTRGYSNEERWMLDIYNYFPGNPKGLLTERIASSLFESFIKEADFTIDMHSALDGATIAPFVYVIPADDQSGTLKLREQSAWAYGTPYVYYHHRGGKFGTTRGGSYELPDAADEAAAPFMLAEMGESRRVTWEYVPIGVRGIRNVMKSLGILEGDPEVPDNQRRFTAFEVAHAGKGGGLRTLVDVGDEVKAGDPVAEIVDVFGQPSETVESPVDGFILRLMRLGSVATGAEIVWVGHSSAVAP